MALWKIVSGGQTGADRAALDAARSRGLPIGGWIPRGRWAEDGRVPEELVELGETESADPADRTRRNVLDSDGTLIVSHGAFRGGSELTRTAAAQSGKPCICIDLRSRGIELAVPEVLDWIDQHQIGVLNVAGPRASEDSEIYTATLALVTSLVTSQR